MIQEIKTIIQNYLNNAKLTSLMLGTVTRDGVKISDKLTIPDELIKGNLKAYMARGDKVRILRNHGGQEFYVVEIIGAEFVRKGSWIVLYDPDAKISYEYIVTDVRNS